MERYRFYNDCPLYYVTFSVVNWLPVFISEAAFQIVADSLNYCHQMKSLRTNAYVIMPTHLHAICFDAEWNSERLEQTLTEFRKFTGRKLVDFCAAHLPGCFTQTMKEVAPEDRDRRFWQATRHPVALINESTWRQKLDYLHVNPRRKGLVRRPADWRYSSAGFFETDGVTTSDVEITRLQWD
jgi:putative transposase